MNFVQQTHLLQVEKNGEKYKKHIEHKIHSKTKNKKGKQTGEKQTKNNIIQKQNPCEG